ncbi:MAG: preprotein translocase subunit SecE [Brevinematia bacterium]
MLKIVNIALLVLIGIGVVIAVVFNWNYVKESFAELKKVSWPSRELAWNSAIVTIVFIVVFSLFLSLLDYLLNLIFLKLVG